MPRDALRRRDVVDVPVIGLAAGLVAIACILLLRLVEQLTFGPHEGPLLHGVASAPPWRRVAGPALVGALAGLGWWAVRRRGEVPSLEDAVRRHEDPSRLGVGRQVVDAALQIVVVGGGASIGREGAPRQASGALAEAWALRTSGSARTLIAAAAGAGLAAVYDTPVAGVLFAVEVIAASRELALVVRGALASALATVIAWPVAPEHPTFSVAPDAAHGSSYAVALVGVPVTVAIGLAFRSIAASARAAAPRPGPALPVLVAASGVLVGSVACWLPSVAGNGKTVIEALPAWAVEHPGGAGVAALGALVVLKPLLGVAHLRAGAVGGLLMPSLSTGGAAGGCAALLLAPGSVVQWAMVGAVGVLAVTQRAPFFAGVFGWELTHVSPSLGLLLVATAFGAHLVADAVTPAASRRSTSARPPRARSCA